MEYSAIHQYGLSWPMLSYADIHQYDSPPTTTYMGYRAGYLMSHSGHMGYSEHMSQYSPVIAWI